MTQPALINNPQYMVPGALAKMEILSEGSPQTFDQTPRKSVQDLMPCAICYKFFPSKQLQSHILSHQNNPQVSFFLGTEG